MRSNIGVIGHYSLVSLHREKEPTAQLRLLLFITHSVLVFRVVLVSDVKKDGGRFPVQSMQSCG